jgi:REP-associated tyrosine transposase
LRLTRQQTASGHTYFVTSQTWQRRALFQNPQWTELFLQTLQSYRGRAYLLHEYVLMPEHFHILITPSVTLERAVQFVEGGFSYRVKKELQSSMEIWQTGFSDYRIRDAEDYRIHVDYVWRNPVGRKLVAGAAEYPYCSAFPGSLKDEVPQWLKPLVQEHACGAPKGAPLQKSQAFIAAKGALLQKQIPHELKPARDDNSQLQLARYKISRSDLKVF